MPALLTGQKAVTLTGKHGSTSTDSELELVVLSTFFIRLVLHPHQTVTAGEQQTISHIVNDCEVFKSPGGTPGLLELDDVTISWLRTDLPL